MTDHLTPLDATFLELEQADESAHMHIGGALVFDPRPDGSVPSLEEVCASTSTARLAHLPRYRRKLSEPRTGGLRWPAWEDDERFDLDVPRAPRDAARRPAATRSCASGSATTGPTASTATGRCGRSCCSTASRTAAGRSSPRPTTRWSTGSGRWTPAT